MTEVTEDTRPSAPPDPELDALIEAGEELPGDEEEFAAPPSDDGVSDDGDTAAAYPWDPEGHLTPRPGRAPG